MNMDQIWGRFGVTRARVKGLAGALMRDRALVLQAKIDFVTRRAQAAFGDAKSAVHERRMLMRSARLPQGR
jgi:hypothetical protein